MQSNNRILDDAAKLAGGALGTLVGVRREIESMVRQQLERLLGGMDLVTRDEFEAVREMAANARAGEERLAQRVAELEARLAALDAKIPSRKPAAPRGAGGKGPKGGAEARDTGST